MVVKITKNSILIKEISDEVEKISKDLKLKASILPTKNCLNICINGCVYEPFFKIEGEKLVGGEMVESTIFEFIKPILEKSKYTWEVDLY